MIQQDDAAADGEGHAQGVREPHRVAERRTGENPVAFAQSIALHQALVGGDQDLGIEYRAFEVAGGAGGEAERGDVARARRERLQGGRGAFPGAAHQGFVAEHAGRLGHRLIADQEDVPKSGIVALQGGAHGPVIVPSEDHGQHQSLGLRQVENPLQLVFAVDDRDVDRHRADPGQGEVENQEGRPVGQLDNHLVARLEAVMSKPDGQAVDLPGHVTIGEAAEHRVEDQLPVTIPFRDLEQPVSDQPSFRAVGHMTLPGSNFSSSGMTSLARRSRWSRRRSGGMTGARIK